MLQDLINLRVVFQSTLLHEERHRLPSRSSLVQNKFQSTLLHEERLMILTLLPHQTHFNPRSYMRSDQNTRTVTALFLEFQSTLLHEERLLIPSNVSAPTSYFNPRSYMRSDGDRPTCVSMILNFNPRSYMRSDAVSSIIFACASHFNPRSYMRSDVKYPSIRVAS